jgi:hypothetical protein
LRGISRALDLLYGDHNIIRPAVSRYRQTESQVTDDMLGAVRDRVATLLPRMLSVVAEHAKKDIAAIPRMPVEVMDASTGELRMSENVYTGGIAAESSLPASNAEAALRLRALGYQRHPFLKHRWHLRR